MVKKYCSGLYILFWLVNSSAMTNLDIPKYGVVGYHPSLLPRNRGRHPIIWLLP